MDMCFGSGPKAENMFYRKFIKSNLGFSRQELYKQLLVETGWHASWTAQTKMFRMDSKEMIYTSDCIPTQPYVFHHDFLISYNWVHITWYAIHHNWYIIMVGLNKPKLNKAHYILTEWMNLPQRFFWVVQFIRIVTTIRTTTLPPSSTKENLKSWISLFNSPTSPSNGEVARRIPPPFLCFHSQFFLHWINMDIEIWINGSRLDIIGLEAAQSWLEYWWLYKDFK